MRNVYDEIQSFYQYHTDPRPVVAQSVLEGFLRKKAWSGCDDAKLRDVWDSLEEFFTYAICMDIRSLDEIDDQEFSEMLVWLNDQAENSEANDAAICNFFAKLREFYEYLKVKKIYCDLDSLVFFMDSTIEDGRVIVPDQMSRGGFLANQMRNADEFSEEMAEELNDLLAELINKIGQYYKNEKFLGDFNRAMALYSGPFNTVPENGGEDFWLGFWDYFLFDYRLASSDIVPIRYFYEDQCNNLDEDELQVMQDLLRAKFTLFYINRIIDPYRVECIDLFTNEKLYLPMPDYGVNDYKKVILYGHIHSEGVVMLNYITSIPASSKLRARIKQEVLKQKNLYNIQAPEADLATFFERHAVNVRHTIDILVNLAKVNVMSPNPAVFDLPVVGERCAPDAALERRFRDAADFYKFSAHAKELLLRLWGDYCTLSPEASVTPAALLGAVLYSFGKINGIDFLSEKELAGRFKVTKSKLEEASEAVSETLRICDFDPRYLTEEGFVLSLYAF